MPPSSRWACRPAACALFQSDQLGLRHPSPDPQAKLAPIDATVLVWGGSTSVGSNAVQLAVAAGYRVIATASPRNFDYVASLGAEQVFDYSSPSVVADVVAALAGRTLAGAIAVGTTSSAGCVRIVGACTGNKFVALASPGVSFDQLATGRRGRFAAPRHVLRLVRWNVALQVRARTHGVRMKFIFGTTLKNNEVSGAIYRDFLPAALAAGRYVAAPPPTVVGHDLTDLQRALDIQRHGVWATKIVVALDSPTR